MSLSSVIVLEREIIMNFEVWFLLDLFLAAKP